MNSCVESDADSAVVMAEAATLAALLRTFPDGGELSLRITGESMVPFYRHGRTTVILRREEGRSPRRGDVVFFLRGDGTPVLHRVLRVGRGSLTVGGDGQRCTEVICLEAVLARVVRVRREPWAREMSADGIGYRLAVRLWSCGRWWHPRVAKWYRRRDRERRLRHGIGPSNGG